MALTSEDAKAQLVKVEGFEEQLAKLTETLEESCSELAKLLQDVFNKAAFLECRVMELQMKVEDGFRLLQNHLKEFDEELGGSVVWFEEFFKIKQLYFSKVQKPGGVEDHWLVAVQCAALQVRRLVDKVA